MKRKLRSIESPYRKHRHSATPSKGGNVHAEFIKNYLKRLSKMKSRR